jgi:SAM-dependent methyltransferase
LFVPDISTTNDVREVKIRESGMPEETYWESLFDVNLVISRLGIDRSLGAVIELGCGYGTFTLPVAHRVRGTLHAFDIEKNMVDRTHQRIVEAGLQNVVLKRRDVIHSGFGVAQGSQAGCLLFNILHSDETNAILCEARRCVRPGGSIFVIHWRSDVATPRGPSLAIRPRPGRSSHRRHPVICSRQATCSTCHRGTSDWCCVYRR